MCTLSIIKAEDNKRVCDGLGCSYAATAVVDEVVDGIGKIVLQLCNDCLAKFREQ
jgi:hypothetical protein